MELEDLKNTWKSIGNEIEQISTPDTEVIVTNHKRDVKTTLLNRLRWGIIVLIAATILLATSRLWAVIKMPVWWISAFCILFASGSVVTTFLLKRIAAINLGEDTQFQVMRQILIIKKIYRNTELYGSAAILLLTIGGILCSPVSYKPIELVLISGATVICYLLEYISYKSNIRKINQMQNWLNKS